MGKASTFCVIVPAYHEAGRIGGVVARIRGHCDAIVVIDDGSSDETAAEAEAAGAHVIRHQTNQGKGVALETGFDYAATQGVEFVITMDADGQHDPVHIAEFVDHYRQTALPVIVGSRMADPRTMPLVRRLTNRFMSWLLSRK
ncbi:MAG: glycosyltransferase family 2 protein, partial [Verrucomicrobia bacterium]|nr:glycosyltransferase family 2 protein [Verrucomicrobiota bacterium]